MGSAAAFMLQTDHATDEPLTRPLARCVREIIRTRTSHQEIPFHGHLRDAVRAEVNAGKGVR